MSAIVEMPVTMTSLELVGFINDHRRQQGDDTVLRHDHFMAKVPKVLGEAAPKFVGTDLYANGTGGMIERDIYRFPKRESCLMAMSYSYELQAAVFDHMTALESKLNQPSAATLPTYSEALRQLADQIDENSRLSAERDHAIATKAQIGGKREATAMATASAASRKARQLEQELGRGVQHATIIAVEKASGRRFGTQGFRPLKQWCKAHDVAPPKVPCPRYGEAVSWPAEAWREVYGVDLGELFGSEGATVDGQLLGGCEA